MREYFRYAAASTKTFSRLFASEFDTINKVAEENVKRLQTQYIKLGRDSSGAMKAIAVMPTQLNMDDFSVKTQMAAQRQALFNQLVKQGSTNLLNFGKNTQWAGRQLMVGFTIPLGILGNVAAKSFMDMETAALKFRKVYGDLFTPAEETQAALDNVKALGEGFTQYGIAVSSTVGLAAEAAAAGFQGLDLQRQVTEATRLQVLGQVDQQKALETTISLQNAFQMSSEDLADSINFLNAVENQTVVSLDDITTAIPKAAPVVKQLGGDVKDLAFFMAAMKEGGINASEGANALKSGLAALINPTNKAREMMKGFGIDIDSIVNKNAGDVKSTVIEFARALDGLSNLDRQRAIEQLFGKFQLARLSTLFENVTKTGNQASRVLDLATASTEDLASMANKELGMTADSAMNKFRKSVEDLKLTLVPVGQTFLEAVTPIIEFIGNILDKFNNLSSGAKKAITILTVAIGAIGPVALMTFGLLANGLANGIKFISILRNGYLRLTGQSKVLGEQTQFLTVQQQEAAAVAHSLDQSHAKLTQTFNAERTSVNQLASAYTNAARAASALLLNNPGMVLPGRTPKKFAEGGFIVGPGTGTSDSIPAMVSNGESIIPAKQTKKYNALIGKIIADKVPGYAKGLFKSVDVPGSADMAHFGGHQSMTGREILALIGDLETATTRSIKKMIGTTEEQLNKTFTVFDNSVINQLTSVNREFSQKGSVSTQTAKNSVLGAGFAETRDAELQNQLMKSGMSMKDFQEVNKKITARITKGFDALGDKTEITSDEFDKLIRTAYEEVAKTDERVKKAYAEMKKITTVYNPEAGSDRGARQAITDDSYVKTRGAGTYVAGRQATGVDPYPEIGRFGIKKSAADMVGLSLGDMAKVYNQMSAQAKIALSKLKDDSKAFAIEFERQATAAGLKVGKAYKTGIDKSAIADPYVGSRDRSSPHILAGKDGADDGNAYETARQNAVKRRRVASSAGGTVGPGGVIIPPMPPSGGGTFLGMPGMPGDGSRGPITDPKILNQAYRQNRLRNIASFAQRPGVGMAASSAFFAASMMPGKTGELAQKAMPAVFGLQALQMALKLPIPHIKAFAAVALAGVGIFKLVNAARERERASLEAFSDVLKTTTDQAQFLKEYFNFEPIKGSLESFGKNLEVTSNKVRSEREKIKESEGFQKAYGKTIKQVSGMSDAEAATSLKFKGVELLSQGMAAEQVQLIIDSIKEEAGKKDLKFDFKNMKFDEKGLGELNKEIGTSLEGFADTYKKGLKKVFQYQAVGEGRSASVKLVEALVPTKEAEAALKNAASLVSSYSQSLNRLVGTGKVNTAQFNKMSDAMFESIGKAVPDSTLQLKVFNAALKQIDPELGKVTEGVNNLKDKQILLKAAIAGVSNEFIINLALAMKTAEALKKVADAANSAGKIDVGAIAAAAFAQNQVAGMKADLPKLIADAIKLKKALNDAFDSESTGGTGEDTPFAKLKKQLEETIANTRNGIVAFNKLRASGVSIADALEMSKDPLIASVLATTKSKKEFDTIVKLIKTMNRELRDSALKDFLNGLKAGNDLKKAFLPLIPELEKLGLKSEEIMDILNNPDVARGMIKGFNNATDKAKYLKQYVDEIVKDRKLKIQIEISTIQGLSDAINQVANDAIRKIDAKGAVIRRAAASGTTGSIDPRIVNLTQAQKDKLAGVNIDAAKKALSDAQAGLKTAQAGVTAVQNQISEKQRLIDINNQLISQQQVFIDNINKDISVQEALMKEKEKYVELNYDKPLKALADENNLLSNYQAQIQRQQKAINEEYDKQQKAMEEMNRLNQQSIEQGKQKISIADALSQGDISAAAQAVQDLRAQEAASNAANMQEAFNASREQALAGVTAGGMNSAQIEERQYQIQQQSFRLEQEKALYIQTYIVPIQEKIASLEASKIPYQEKINELTNTNAGIQRDIESLQLNQLYNAEQAVISAQELVDEKQAELEKQEAIVDEIINGLTEGEKTKDQWEEIKEKVEAADAAVDALTSSIGEAEAAAAAVKAIWDSIQDKTVTITFKYVEEGSPGGGGGGGGTGLGTAKVATFGGYMQRYAIGGTVVPGEGLLDKVHALLTPGEFVMNKSATKAWRPTLEAMNDQVYPGIGRLDNPRSTRPVKQELSFDTPRFPTATLPTTAQGPTNIRVNKQQVSTDNSSTVYNYNVDISVNGNNMDADAVANNVMFKIRQLQDNQVRRRLK
jgi:TP901 family phage tail tape measure protein